MITNTHACLLHFLEILNEHFDFSRKSYGIHSDGYEPYHALGNKCALGQSISIRHPLHRHDSARTVRDGTLQQPLGVWRRDGKSNSNAQHCLRRLFRLHPDGHSLGKVRLATAMETPLLRRSDGGGEVGGGVVEGERKYISLNCI